MMDLRLVLTLLYLRLSMGSKVQLRHHNYNYCQHSEELKSIKFDDDYNYHSYPKPLNRSEPLDIGFQVNLRNVLEVNELSQICALETTIRLYWVDHRVKMAFPNLHEYVTLNPKAAERFWIPDIFIDQAKEMRIPTYFVRPASIRIYNNSKIRYATRVNFDVACKMDFKHYPIDEQICEIKLESFGYTSKQMKFRWLDKNNINQNISLPQFDLSVRLGDDYATDYYDLPYPGVIMRIILRRKMSYHLWQTYLPSSIFVIVAWMSALVPPEQVPGRATMTTTTLLTLTAMFGAVRSNVPRVSYSTLLDVWMFVCIVFVFLVIIHFVAVISLLRYNRKSTAETLEYCGIVGIPILFLIFNGVYWHTLVSTWWHQNHD